jgi:hypothetical protein
MIVGGWADAFLGMSSTMLDRDRRQTESEAERDELKVIVCLSAALVLAVALVGLSLATSIWPTMAI